jgi:hypothetical protein
LFNAGLQLSKHACCCRGRRIFGSTAMVLNFQKQILRQLRSQENGRRGKTPVIAVFHAMQ